MTKSSKINRLLAATAALGLVAAPQGGVTAQTTAAPVQAISAKMHPQLVAEFGGAVTGPQALYVESVGKKIAVQSGLSNAQGDFTVTLLNSSVDNAFAIPGGYIYTTRQLVALMNNEAELAGVLGHEVWHVVARHSSKRQSAATKNAVLGTGLAILSGILLGNSQVGQVLQKGLLQGSQLLTLRYSRAQETDADNGGITPPQEKSYDPRAPSPPPQLSWPHCPAWRAKPPPPFRFWFARRIAETISICQRRAAPYSCGEER